MAVERTNVVVRKQVWTQWNTQNKSFLDVQKMLEGKGIKHNTFFLYVVDPDLMKINPRDPNLNFMMKQKVLRECQVNYWYFIREIVRVPDQGGSANSGKMYQLHRGNLAMNFCLCNNWNIFAELPRQHGKTIGVVIRILWEFLFGTSNSEMSFINKKYEDSKLNLSRLKEIRRALPVYLQMTQETTDPTTGKKIKPKDSAEYLENLFRRNKIVTIASANSKVKANSLGRGCTQPRQWYDEFAFIPYNKIVYLSATPAYNTASANARLNGAPYGIIITTTPGDLTTEEGKYAYRMTELATQFNEMWYDMSLPELQEMLSHNKNSSFIYIRFTYKELGHGEDWFAKIVIDMQKDWDAIRREVLLEWSDASDNSPFSKDDLEIVSRLCHNPIMKQRIYKNFMVNIYKMFRSEEEMNSDTYIMGVDVSGGLKRDSSTFTMISAKTTKVIADFNCNYINQHELAAVIREFVKRNHITNIVINIERNGGFGQAVLADLKNSDMRPYLYFEMKQKVIEERVENGFTTRQKAMVRNFGFDNTGRSREMLMEILRERMANHKDKFVSNNIARELKTLIVTKSGKIDHTPTGHDDQIFSYLMAMYVWNEGKYLKEQWGIEKGSIMTEKDEYEEVLQFNEGFQDITTPLQNIIKNNGEKSETDKALEYLMKGKGMTYEDYLRKQKEKEDRQLQAFLQMSPLHVQAYAKAMNKNPEQIQRQLSMGGYKLPDTVFNGFNGNPEDYKNPYTNQQILDDPY